MPRTNEVYALLAGMKGVTLQIIQSGKYSPFLDDFVADANAPRPIIAGGTGAASPDQAAPNLASCPRRTGQASTRSVARPTRLRSRLTVTIPSTRTRCS
nr:hypothetical protein RFYW14_00607 [Pseudorhizobium flavum]